MAQYLATQIHTIFGDILNSLVEKERNIISRRIGIFGEKETLQSIGESYQITRERVRQIEDVGIKKIGRIIQSSPLVQIQAAGEKILQLHGGVMTKDALITAIVDLVGIDGVVNHNMIDIILQADFNIHRSKPQLGTRAYFHSPDIHKRTIEAIHKEALKIMKKRGDIMEHAHLYEMIKIELAPSFPKIDIPMIHSIMDIYLDIVRGEEKYIGLEKWKILNPATLKDKAVYILKKRREPMHFLDITNAIMEYFQEPVKVSTIHNELIRNTDFVLIGRGIYVLKEMGYTEGTVLDVILDVFAKAKGPLSTEEIITKVQKHRLVKDTTIYMNLQNKEHIERVGRNLYQAKK